MSHEHKTVLMNEQTIIKAMARAMFVSAWVNHEEEHGLTLEAGVDIMDLVPCTPESAVCAAYRLVGKIEQKNGACFMCLFEKTCGDLEHTDKLYRDFGHYVAMEALGHGVSFADDYTDLAFDLPLVEYYLDD